MAGSNAEFETPNEKLRNSPDSRSLWADESGASLVEFALIVAAIAVPMYLVIRVGLATMAGHYAMTTFLNGWPFP